MNLNELSAKELARIDAICLKFEALLRAGKVESIDAIVERLGGKHADILRAELEAVYAEVHKPTPAKPTPAKPKSAPASPQRSAAGAPAVTPQTSLRTPNQLLDQTVAPSSSPDEHTALWSATSNEVGPGPQRSPLAGAQPAGSPAVRRPHSAEASEFPNPGDRIGPYLLGGVLGRGGMGIVYKATDTRLDRSVAIKMLAPVGSNRQGLVERFQREAKAVAALSHPNIVELFDVGIAGSVPYAVMEYLHGDVLVDRLKGTPMPPADVRLIGAQIADALTAAHSGGVIHRDLKPHNIILVRRQGGDSLRSANQFISSDDTNPTTIVKLVDFGLSRQPRNPKTQTDGETRVGTVMGTPGYMAPEQARGEAVTPAADIFALGCILFEAFYGQRAFDGATPAARFAAVLESTPQGDAVIRDQDPQLAELIDRCLEKSIEKRPTTAAGIANELRNDPRFAPSSSDESDEDPWDVPLPRRRFFEAAMGGVTGILGGWLLSENHAAELRAVRRVAVISLADATKTVDAAKIDEAARSVIGGRAFGQGEELSAMLAKQLQSLREIEVRPYRPILATTPDEFKLLGRELDVDAVITGTRATDVRGSKRFLEIDLQLVSTLSGRQIWSETIVAEQATSLLEQSELMSRLVSALGRRLVQTNDSRPLKTQTETYGCLAKGFAYLDPDNTLEGLDMARLCFEHAISVDARYPDAHAGLALTYLAMATRGLEQEPTEIQAKVALARERTQYAIDLDSQSIDGQFAQAMLDWQTLFEYDKAKQVLSELASKRPNDWRFWHQLGLIAATLNETHEAREALARAVRLNPNAIMLHTDLARLEWYSGNAERAITAAEELCKRFVSHQIALGLLIDIHEHQQQYSLAAKYDRGMKYSGTSAHDYFVARRERLEQIPYGPFGAIADVAMCDARQLGGGIGESHLEVLTTAQSPSLPLLLARHPLFGAAKNLDAARPIIASTT